MNMYRGGSQQCLPLLLVFLALLACSDELWSGLETGPHPVGFRIEDLTRTTSDGTVRRVRLALWYPRNGTGSSPVRLGDLIRLVEDEQQLPEPAGMSQPARLAFILTGDSTAIAPERARGALGMETGAERDADPAPGPFPLVLWSSRHATVLAQAPLAHVLASQGHVVATAWSSDPPLAFLWENRPVEEKLATIRAQPRTSSSFSAD